VSGYVKVVEARFIQLNPFLIRGYVSVFSTNCRGVKQGRETFSVREDIEAKPTPSQPWPHAVALLWEELFLPARHW
jgi:hypothetical protein